MNPHCEHVRLFCIFWQGQYPLNFAGRSQAARVLWQPDLVSVQCYHSPTFHLGGLPVTSVIETVSLVRLAFASQIWRWWTFASAGDADGEDWPAATLGECPGGGRRRLRGGQGMLQCSRVDQRHCELPVTHRNTHTHTHTSCSLQKQLTVESDASKKTPPTWLFLEYSAHVCFHVSLIN